MNNYVIHTCIKCSDGKDHRLSYDLGSSKLTDEGMREIGRIFEGHLHYSMPNAVYLNDPNVELFRKGPLGITIRMRKPTK